MKTLTVRQPHAKLIAMGIKGIETRSWSTKHRGLIAIHAGKAPATRTPNVEQVGSYCYTTEWLAPIHSFDGYTHEPIADVIGEQLVYGFIVATAYLVDVIASVELDGADSYSQQGRTPETTGSWNLKHQRPYGDFSLGFLWLLGTIKRLETPIPATGRQGLWNWER